MTRATASAAQTGRAALPDLHIALDPGHLGGTWAKMEERWFKIGDAPPVQEGDMTLRVAQMLAPRLEPLGAKVSLVRDKPSRSRRTGRTISKSWPRRFLKKGGITQPREDFDGPADPEKEQSVLGNARFFFIATARSGSAQKS